MALTVQQFFTSSINGVTVNDIKNKLDYKNVHNFNDRLSLVNETLQFGDEFYQQYFDEYFDVCISNDDFLLSDTNVCKSLETIGTYLLMSEDVKNENENFAARQQQLEKRMSKENEIGTDGMTDLLENAEDEDEFKDNSNYKLEKIQTIKKEDLNKQNEMGELLKQYQAFLDDIQYKLKQGNSHLRLKPRFIYTTHSSAVKDDMIILKESFMGIHGYKLKHYSVESRTPDYDAIDFTNVRHLLGATLASSNRNVKAKGLLYFKPTSDYQDDFNCQLIDLQNIIDKTNLTEFEKDVLELNRYSLSNVDIASELGTYDTKVKRTMKTIAKKVSKQAYAMGYKDKGGIKNLT